jgi:UDP-N-acetylmuramyl pentapeptide phosphotransferase/UDP-N-acetylglucosamine-1-phosphate transferase
MPLPATSRQQHHEQQHSPALPATRAGTSLQQLASTAHAIHFYGTALGVLGLIHSANLMLGIAGLAGTPCQVAPRGTVSPFMTCRRAMAEQQEFH